ncbi:hypothetical protein K470DRAFT_219428 [Piedraia hortae CBS 480.64]|uniref:Vacuolar membrane-associated protein IML1 n=1 Tax=Piedraia hortae CBS 480.64 TaxID=1314780 RepID=A0A6A7BVW3_9PEZI|nr:hypothetical protein K470DRAFT_219428 [Piedraia hortae CBS 480.64]
MTVRGCTVVLHDDSVSQEKVLCGVDVLPLGGLAYLEAPGANRLCIKSRQSGRNANEISLHVSLALRFGYQNQITASLKVLNDPREATATHIELFFTDKNLSRSDMWRISQHLDQAVCYQGQKISLMGSVMAEIVAIYTAGRKVSSAYTTEMHTKPIFRSGNARFTLLVQVSKEMLEYWSHGDLMYEVLLTGFLPELFRRWQELNVSHQVSLVLFGRICAPADPSVADFYHVIAPDMVRISPTELIRVLKKAIHDMKLPRDVTLAAKGNMLEAIHMASIGYAHDKIDPHLSCTGSSIIAVTAGTGVFETTHDMLQNTTRLLMGSSIGVDIVSLAANPLHPAPLFSYQRKNQLEYALPHWVNISYWQDGGAHWVLPGCDDGVIDVALPPLGVGEYTAESMNAFDEGVFGSPPVQKLPVVKKAPSRSFASRKISLGPKGLVPGKGTASVSVSIENVEHERDSFPSPQILPSDVKGAAMQIRHSLTKKRSQQSIASQSTAPVDIPKPVDTRPSGNGSLLEDSLFNLADEQESSLTTLKASLDPFSDAVKAAEAEGAWETCPWLTLLNPCNPKVGNIRVAAQYRQWQNVFPETVHSSDFKWASMCSPAALPLTTDYRPTQRELERYPHKLVRRLLIPKECSMDVIVEGLVLTRLTMGFQIARNRLSVASVGESRSGERILLSLGNLHHELQCLSDTEVQIVEYAIHESGSTQKDSYRAAIKTIYSDRARIFNIPLTASKTQLDWPALDDCIVSENPSSTTPAGSSKMRLVLLPVESQSASLGRGLTDDERHIEGIQKLTQLWQRSRFFTADGQKYLASLASASSVDPNPLSIEYQTRDPSAVVNAWEPIPYGNGVAMAPLFAEAEMFHSSNFDVHRLVKQMQEAPPHGVELRDRRWLTRLHLKCFRGDEMVNWLLRVFKDVASRDDAVEIGNELMKRGIFSHVRRKHDFRDGNYFYQIASAHRTVETLAQVPSPSPSSSHEVDKAILLSEALLYNVSPKPPPEAIVLHCDRIHNPHNCYRIQLEWVSTPAFLIREAVTRWSGAAESYGLRLVQVPLFEVCSLPKLYPFDQPVCIPLAIAVGKSPKHGEEDTTNESQRDRQKCLLRHLDFVLDTEPASAFSAEVRYSFGKLETAMVQFVHRTGLVLAQMDLERVYLAPNRLHSTTDKEVVREIISRVREFCMDEGSLRTFWEDLSQEGEN